MAYSYDDALTADRDQIRLRIGDTVEDSGPRPDGRNFADAEIAFILSEEGSVTAAIAHCFEILAAEWSQVPSTDREGNTTIVSDKNVEYFQGLATKWRRKAGGGGMVTLTRTDAYTDD